MVIDVVILNNFAPLQEADLCKGDLDSDLEDGVCY